MQPSDLDEALRAHICVAYFRAFRLDVLRWLAVASLPLWYQAATGKLPETVAWILGLIVATLASLAIVYAFLECRWGRRARRGRLPRFAVSRGANLHEDLRAGLLCGWGLASLAPGVAALGAPVSSDLLAALSPLALSLVAARIALEARRRPSLPRRAPRRQRAWAGRFGVR